MSVDEVKKDLHKMLAETNDIIILQQLRQYFKALTDDTYDWLD